MSATLQMIERTERDAVAWLRMAHGKANALDLEFLRALTGTLRDTARSGVRAVVLTGTGGIFSAGVDLFRLTQGGPSYVRELIPALSECLQTLFAFPAPVVAAMNGHAIAGGMIVACACDRRLMVRGRGRVGVPEVRVGVPFPWLPLEIVRFALSPPAANEAILVGDTYSCDEALRLGIVDELVDESDLVTKAGEVAARFAAITPVAFRETKLRLRGPLLAEWDRIGRDTDARAIEHWSSDEVQSAVRAYVAKTLR